jgi:hypothetical protein
MLDSLVRVSRRVASSHYASILSTKSVRRPAQKRVCCEPRSRSSYPVKSYNTYPRVCYVLSTLIRRSKSMLAWQKMNTPKGWTFKAISDLKRFPFDNFTYCLTLFPKCFSSFPHGTCLLSVSPQYLALDGIYHPFWAAFPNNSTLRKCITKHWASIACTGFSPSMTSYSKEHIYGPARKTLL